MFSTFPYFSKLLYYSTAAGIVAYFFRVFYTSNLGYWFLLWNIFLAWLPLWLAVYAAKRYNHSHKISWNILAAAFLWLIFLPNAPYILTDFIHLNDYRSTIPVWYDFLLVTWFSWLGLLLGILSMIQMQTIVTQRWNQKTGWALIFIVSFASGFAIYLGRFLRWNSWDVLLHPWQLAREIYTIALYDPIMWSLTLGVGIGLSLLYAMFKKLTALP